MCPLVKRPEGHLFIQLLEQLKLFAGFEIDDMSGEQLNQQQTTERHYKAITKLQVKFLIKIIVEGQNGFPIPAY